MGLDSIYAMTAVPARAELERKRKVNQVKKSDNIHPDSHEAPQSQLPPNLERRKHRKERREFLDSDRKPRVDRRTSLGRRDGEEVEEEVQSEHLIDVMV